MSLVLEVHFDVREILLQSYVIAIWNPLVTE